MSPVALFLIQALLALAVPVILWRLVRLRRWLPLAVVQIAVGIILGPTLLGGWAPVSPLISAEALVPLAGIANFAVILFGFVIGLHLDPAQLRGSGPALVILGCGSALVPAALGAGAGLILATQHPQTIGVHASPMAFAAAIGICAGVTALPVLASILLQMRLGQYRLGQLALSCAAINDALLWVALAALLAWGVPAAHPAVGPWPALLGGPLLVAMLLLVVRPWLARQARPGQRIDDLRLAGVSAFMLATAAITEVLGLHAVLGAFLAGLSLPPPWRQAIAARIEGPVAVLLMPFFFVLTGLRTDIDFSSPAFVATLTLTLAASTVGKVLGTAILARLAGEPWREALALGALMQTKGLMEIVVLTILKDAGVIGAAAFSALVVMALISTALTMPLVRAVLRRGEAAAPST